jgi:delta1-piperideine-2-carboxylate reductase
MLLPFGSYKGSNISMAIELLAGPLLGETTSFETKQKDDRQGPPLGDRKRAREREREGLR